MSLMRQVWSDPTFLSIVAKVQANGSAAPQAPLPRDEQLILNNGGPDALKSYQAAKSGQANPGPANPPAPLPPDEQFLLNQGGPDALKTYPGAAGPASGSGGPAQGGDAPGEPDAALDATSTEFFFDKNSAELTDRDKEMLDAYASAYLREKSSASVEVDGFASIEGDATLNDKLSRQRADSVAAYLKKLGVSNVAPKGHGAKGSKDALRQNRRVTIKPPPNLTVRDIVGEPVIEPPLPGTTPNPTLGEKADEPDISKIPIPEPPPPPGNVELEENLKGDPIKKSLEFEVAVTFGLRDKKTKKVVLTELQVSGKLKVDTAGNLEAGWEVQLALWKDTWEAKLKWVGKIEVEATLSVNAEGPLSPDILKNVETTVQGELKVKHGHIALGANIKVGPDGKPVPGVFAEWTF
jgi:outer membrane protein OmpA-like peptidoglycan-associated protein